MSRLPDMFHIETLRAIRSNVPLFTCLGYMMLPLAACFFIFVLGESPEQYFVRLAGVNGENHHERAA